MNIKENVTPIASPTVTIDKTVIKLTRPLVTHNGQVTELTLAEPRADLLLRHGLPWKQIMIPGGPDGGPKQLEIEFIPDKMAFYIEEMSGVDSITLGGMAARDMNRCFIAVMNMLQPTGN